MHTFFRDIEVGSYFFFAGNTIPVYKVGEGAYTEGGSAVHRYAGGGERVVPIAFERDGDGCAKLMRIGYHSIPIPTGPETRI